MEDQSQRQLKHHVPRMSVRFFAFYLDEGLRWMVLAPFLGMYFFAGLWGQVSVVTSGTLVLVFLSLVCFRVLCLYYAGGSIGKLVWGLRVRHRDGGELTLMQSILRVVADELAIFFAFAPRALAFFRWDRTHLSDWIAETRVISLKEQNFIPEVRPLWGAVLVIVGLYWGVANLL